MLQVIGGGGGVVGLGGGEQEALSVGNRRVRGSARRRERGPRRQQPVGFCLPLLQFMLDSGLPQLD